MIEVRIRGLTELGSELKRIDPKLNRAIGKANKQIAERIVDKARPAVAGLPSPGGSKAIGGLTARANQKSARVTLLGRNDTIRANVFGTLSHKVWGRNVSGRGPWQPWIGNEWQPEELYGLGPAYGEVMDNSALDDVADAWMEGLKAAFPN